MDKNEIQQRLDFINGEIDKKERAVSNLRMVYTVGVIGMGYGILSIDEGKVIAGLIVSMTGLIFELINSNRLIDFEFERDMLELNLGYSDDGTDYNFDDKKGGKHFKK